MDKQTWKMLQPNVHTFCICFAAYFRLPEHSAEDLEVHGIEKIHKRDNRVEETKKL